MLQDAPLGQASIPVQPYSVDTGAGGHDGAVSRQWFSRPADQRFPDLNTLREFKKCQFENSWEVRTRTRDFHIDAPIPESKKDFETLTVGVPNVRQPGADIVRTVDVAPTHWSFGQLCSLAKAPASYLRELPSQMVSEQLTYRMRYARDVEEVKLYGGESDLFAATGPTYGRIPDHEVVEAVQRLAGNGLGDDPAFHWKTPGKLNWSNGTYDPENIGGVNDRTFYASDRDLFIFVVDDRRPILVGKTRDGRPDFMFRGFYATNSEVGKSTLTIKSFYLRGVCENRNLWGCEGFQEVKIRHTSLAPSRWVEEVRPALEAFGQASDRKLVECVAAAKDAVLAKDDDDELAFLQKRCEFSKSMSRKVMEIHAKEEGAPMRSAWDFAQGITAYARGSVNTDTRLELEAVAGKILDKVA